MTANPPLFRHRFYGAVKGYLGAIRNGSRIAAREMPQGSPSKQPMLGHTLWSLRRAVGHQNGHRNQSVGGKITGPTGVLRSSALIWVELLLGAERIPASKGEIPAD